MAIALLGNMANETIDFKVYTCDSDGSNATLLTSITQLAASATTNDNKQAILQLNADHMPTGKRYLKFSLLTGGATGGPAAIVALGLEPKYGPASDYNLTSVVQIVG
jgi:hypothetical protein